MLPIIKENIQSQEFSGREKYTIFLIAFSTEESFSVI
jgi:hypothetical protein